MEVKIFNGVSTYSAAKLYKTWLASNQNITIISTTCADSVFTVTYIKN